MLKVVNSSVPIVDPCLVPKIWNNTSGETHRFESYLEEKYAGRAELLVANPRIILSAHGERTFLPHVYYRHWPVSGRPVSHSSGRWEMYDERAHALLLAEFVRRWRNARDPRVE